MTRTIALVCAAIAVVLGGYVFMTKYGSNQLPANPLASAANAQSTGEVDTSSIVEMVQGSPDAPVTITEYASYTCPHCAAFHQGPYKQLKADYIDTGKVRLIYREVYFDKHGLWASMLSRCAGPEKFFGITELIYSGQSEWLDAGDAGAKVEELRKIGRLAGLENDAIEACLQDGANAQALVAWFQQNAEQDEISSTPSFFINDQKVTNMPYSEFSALIDAELGS